LEPAEQHPGIQPALVGQWWTLDRSVEPDQRLVEWAHRRRICRIRHTVKCGAIAVVDADKVKVFDAGSETELPEECRRSCIAVFFRGLRVGLEVRIRGELHSPSSSPYCFPVRGESGHWEERCSLA
jgi:hypothetical protein